jgi:hypothetical protein
MRRRIDDSVVVPVVGLSGCVVALDINPQEVERARQKLMESGLVNTDFIATSVENVLSVGRDFDFIYGRFILMQLPNPFEILERLVAFGDADQGGAFVPTYLSLAPGSPDVQTWIIGFRVDLAENECCK